MSSTEQRRRFCGFRHEWGDPARLGISELRAQLVTIERLDGLSCLERAGGKKTIGYDEIHPESLWEKL